MKAVAWLLKSPQATAPPTAVPVEVLLDPALELGASVILDRTLTSPCARTSAAGATEAVASLTDSVKDTAPEALNLPSLMPGNMNLVMLSDWPELSWPVAPRTPPTTLRCMPACRLVILADSVLGSPRVEASALVASLMSASAVTVALPLSARALPPKVAVVADVVWLRASASPTPLPPVLAAMASALISALVCASTSTLPPLSWAPLPTSALVTMSVLARTKVASMGLLTVLMVAVTSMSVLVRAFTCRAWAAVS